VIRSSRGGMVSRRILIAAAAALAPLIAGCEAGTNAPTLNWHQPTDGTFAQVSRNITVSNAFVLGAPIGAVLKQGHNAALFLAIVNTGARDRLIAVKAPGVAKSVQLPAGGVRLATQSRVLLSGPQPAVVLTDLNSPLTGGSVVPITLIFARAGAHTIQVPVMPMASNYTTLSPAPPPSSASPSPSATGRRARKSATPTPSPSSSH
jgi:copper(I)-binding protein